MELKIKSKSEKDFKKARQQTMIRLKSLTKFNGVLQNIQFQTKKKRAISLPQQNNNISNVESKTIKKETKKESIKLPAVRRPLKINTLKDVAKLTPQEGYVQFEIAQKKGSDNLFSTVSPDGIILSQNNAVQFWNPKQFLTRSLSIEKLKKIETIKYLSILKPFLKWKRYSKVKRFQLLKQNLKNKINVNIMLQRGSIYCKLVEYLQRHRYDYLHYILWNLKILTKDRQPKRLDFLKILVKSLQKSYECMITQQDNKNVYSLQADIKALTKLSVLAYRQLCQEYSIKMAELINETISKQFSRNRHNQREYRQIIMGNKEKQVSNISTLVILQPDKNNQIVGKVSGNSIFNPYAPTAHNIDLKDIIFQAIRNTKNSLVQLIKTKVPLILQAVQNIKLDWVIENQKFIQTFKNLKGNLVAISDQNSKDFKIFISYLKLEIEAIEKIDMGAANKVVQIKDKLNIIQAMPEKIYLGMLTIDIQSLKLNLKQKIGGFWAESCQKLPKDINLLFKRIQEEAEEMENKISASIWTISDIVVAWNENAKFSSWVETNIHKISDIQSMLEVMAKVNPRISETFSVRYIQFKQRMKSIAVKSKAFQKSLPERLKSAAVQKKQLIEVVQHQLKQFCKDLIQIRRMQIFDGLASILTTKMQQYKNRIKDHLEHLMKFILIQKNMCEGKQSKYMNKIRNSYNDYEREITFYILLMKTQHKIVVQIQSYIDQWGGQKIIDFVNPEKLIEGMKFQIKKLNKSCQQLNILINPLIQSIISRYKEKLQFFKSFQILKRSFHLQSESGRQVKKTVKQFSDSKIHIQLQQQLLQIEQKLNVIQNFAKMQNEVENKLKEHKILPSYETNLKQEEFDSISQAIGILNESIQIQDSKIKNIGTCFDQNWKQFFRDDCSKTIQNLKNNQKTIQLLAKIKQLVKIYLKHKDIKYAVFLQNGVGLKEKWLLLFNQYQSCSLWNFIKKIKNVEKSLSQIQDAQLEIQEKIETLLSKTYESFPLLYMYDKNIALKTIFDPLFFIQYFLSDFEITNEQEYSSIKSRFGQNLQINLKRNEISLRNFFTAVERQIKKMMIEMYEAINNSSNYSFSTLIGLNCQRMPLQIVTFLDLIKFYELNRGKQSKQKIGLQIEELTKLMSGLNKNWKNLDQSIYWNQAFQLIIMNRIQKRDLAAMNNSNFFIPTYQFQQSDSHFYFSMCNNRTKLSYHLISPTKSSPITTNHQLYLLASIHQSYSNPQCTLILQDSFWLEAYSYRVMKYSLNFPLLSNNFRLIVFAALKAKVIINFSHSSNLEDSIFQKVHSELFNLYYEKNERINSCTSWLKKRLEWPIFLTFPSMPKSRYAKISAQMRVFFRNLSVPPPQVSSILQWAIRGSSESVFTSSMIKLIPSTDGTIQNNRYADLKRVFLKFCKMYNEVGFSNLKPFISSKLLQHIIQKMISQIEIIANYNKLTFNKFIKIIKWFLTSFLIGLIPKNKFLLQNQSKTSYNIRSLTSIQNQQSSSHQNISSTNKISNEQQEKNERKQIFQSDYYSSKADQFKQIIKQYKMIGVLGPTYSGKSYFLNKYLQSCPGYPQQIIRLHPSALGQKIWHQEQSIFKDHKLHFHKTHLIFEGNFEAKNYYMFQKMLQNKCLYYKSGGKVNLYPNSKIIFEVSNSDSIDPYVLVQMRWVSLTASQLKWRIILHNNLESFKTELIKKETQQRRNMGIFQKYVKQIFSLIAIQFQQLLFRMFQNDFEQHFNEITNCNHLIIVSFVKLRVLTPQCSQILDDHYLQQPNLPQSKSAIISLFIYCLCITIKFGNYRQKNKMIQRTKLVFAKYLKPDLQKLDQMIPRIYFSNGIKLIRFQPAVVDKFCYFSLAPSSIFVPNHRQILKSYFTSKMIQNKCNFLVIGRQCTGKSTLVKNLDINQSIETVRLNLKGSYDNMLEKIKYKSGLKQTFGLRKISHDHNITIFVQDLSLSLDRDLQLADRLKYLWQCKLFIDESILKKQDGLNFVVQWDQFYTIPREFIHLNHVYAREQTFPQSIYNHLISSCLKHDGIAMTSISSYEHAQLNSILTLIQNLKQIFEPTYLKDWKHKYGKQIVVKGIDIYFKNKGKDLHKLSQYFNHKVNQQQIVYSQSPIFMQIRIIICHLLSLSMKKQQKEMFNKFAFKINTMQSDSSLKINEINKLFSSQNQLNQTHTFAFQQKKNLIQNIRKIRFASEISNFIFVQFLSFQSGSTALSTIKQIGNTNIVQMKNFFSRFRDFLYFVKEKCKICSFEEKDKKVIFYFPHEYLKMDENGILQFLSELCYLYKNEQCEQNLKNCIFLVQYDANDKFFIQDILKLKCLQRQAITVILEEEQPKAIQMQITSTLQQELNSIQMGSCLLQKLFKVFKKLQDRVHSNLDDNCKLKQQKKLNALEDISLCNHHSFNLSWSKMETYAKQILITYKKQNKEHNIKQLRIKNSMKQLQKIILQHRQMCSKISELQLDIIKKQSQVKKQREIYLRMKQVYLAQQGKFKSKQQFKTDCQQQKKSQEKDPNRERIRLKKCFKQSLASINRTQISELKYVFSNNKQLYRELFDCIGLTLNGQTDNNSLYKILMDVNLTNKIREFKFRDRSTQCLEVIGSKTKESLLKMEDKHILRNIVEWMHYGASFQIHIRSKTEHKKIKLQPQIQDEVVQQLNLDEQIKLQQLYQEVEEKQEQLTQLESQLSSKKQQQFALRTLVSKLQYFEYFLQFMGICQSQIIRISQLKSQLTARIIYGVLCFELLTNLSLSELTNMKKHIKCSVAQQFQNFEIEKNEDYLWKSIYEASTLEKEYQIQKTIEDDVESRIKANKAIKNKWLQKHKQQVRSCFVPTNHQIMKLYSFLKAVKMRKNIIVIDRQQMFSKIIRYYSGSLHVKTENQKLNQIFCYAVEIMDQQWKIVEKQILLQKINGGQNRFKNLSNFGKFQFFISKSLGCFDRRLYKDSHFLQNFDIFDFGIDMEDVKQFIQKNIKLILNQKELKSEVYYKKKLKLAEKQIELYVLQNKMINWLPQTSLDQSERINKLCLILKLWKQKYQQMVVSNELKHSADKNSVEIQNYVSQFYQIYQAFQFAHRISLQMKQTKLMKVLNAPEKFMTIFQKTIEQTLSLNIKQTQLKITSIRNLLLSKLFETDISSSFIILFFLKVHAKSIDDRITQKDVINLIYLAPLEIRLKKLLNYRGSDLELMQIEQLPHRNPNLQMQVRRLLQIVKSPDKFLRGANKQMTNEETLRQIILNTKETTFVQKMTLINIFIPGSCSKVLSVQIQKLMQRLACPPQYINQKNNLRADSIRTYVCLCNLKLWKIFLPVQNEELLSNKSLIQKQNVLKIYCYNSADKLQESVCCDRSQKVILVSDNRSQHESILEQLNNKKLSYELISIQKFLQLFWGQLVMSNQKYKLYESLDCQIKQGSYVEKYLSFKRFQKRINQILCNKKQEADISSVRFNEQNLGPSFYQEEGSQQLRAAIAECGMKEGKLNYKQQHNQNFKGNVDGQVILSSEQEANIAKNIYMGMRKIQYNPFLEPETHEEDSYRIKEFFDCLKRSSSNLSINSIKSIAQELRLKLYQALHENKPQLSKKQQSIRAQIQKIYNKLKQRHFSANLRHEHLVLRSTRLSQLNQLIAQLYQMLYDYSKAKSHSSLQQGLTIETDATKVYFATKGIYSSAHQI